MKNFLQEGNILPFTAPAGGVVSGGAYLIGAIVVVAARDAAAGAEFDGVIEGAFSLPKAAPLVIAEGAIVYWDNTAKNVTTTSAGNTKIGFAYGVGGALSADTTIKVSLTGQV